VEGKEWLQMSASGDVYALLIGINDYECDAVRNLQFAVADVRALRELLIKRMGLNLANSLLLSYPAIESAPTPRRADVLRALDRFSGAPMRPEDTFVLYFAGHGFASDEASYLLTVDSDPSSSNLLRETAVSLATIKHFMRDIRAGQQLLILDACRNEPTTLTRGTASTCFDVAMARDIAALVREEGGSVREDTARTRAILSACWQGQVSYEYQPGGQSWFCHNLLETLRTHVDDEIEITRLTELVRERMRANAWRELPPAKSQEPYLVLEGRSLRLRMASADSAGPRVPKVTALPTEAIEKSQRPLPPKLSPVSIQEPWTNDIGISFRLIQQGRFAMGASPGDSAASADEQPRMTLAIARPFWAATFPLTNAVVRRFLENASPDDDSRFAKLRKDRSFASQLRRGKVDDNLPATEISHDDAVILCAWLQSLDGRNYRLPVEAEWEYMARAGAAGPYWWKDESIVKEYVVFAATGPAPVDSGRANGWGLIDILGNVAEWTSSHYDQIDSGAAMRSADAISGDARVVRGGSWRSKTLEELRVSRRKSMFRRTRADDLGVRIVCDFDWPEPKKEPAHVARPHESNVSPTVIPNPVAPSQQPRLCEDIRILCPSCGRSLRVAERFAGRELPCPACKTLLHVSADGRGLVLARTAPLYESFNEHARKVIQWANQEAQRFNHEYIGSEHVLLGLTKDGDGVAVSVLKSLGVEPKQIVLEVEKLVVSGDPRECTGKLPLAPAAKRAIKYARQEALNLNHDYIGPEHILLGLLRDNEGVAGQILRNIGLQLGNVREEVQATLRRVAD
jgi:formylglycine-generating enzyme required for sulfatase activity